MFGKRKEGQVNSVVVDEALESPSYPEARVPLRLVDPNKKLSYEEVARELGFVPTELIRVQLIEFFEEEGIKLYDYDQVSSWLTKKKEEAGRDRWCWRPLREKDIIEDYHWGSFSWGKPMEDGYYSSGFNNCRPYDRLVPMHALEKVIRIEKKFENQVKFFVSDYVDPEVDPFIMVRPTTSDSGTPAQYCLIFDAWDEPGFGD